MDVRTSGPGGPARPHDASRTGLSGAPADLGAVWRAHCADWCAWGLQPEAAGLFAVERRPGVVCAWWLGPPHDMQHNLWVDAPPEGDPAEVLGLVRGSRGTVDLRLPVAPGAGRWSGAAHRLGYSLAELNPLMACPLPAPAAATPPPGIAVGLADGPGDYEAALGVVEAVFGGPHVLTRFFAPRQGCRVYLGRWEGVPAAAASVRPGDGLADIYSVSTRPQFRRRGLARALLHCILATEAAHGLTTASLRTIDALVPYYGRLGFRVVGQSQRLRRPTLR